MVRPDGHGGYVTLELRRNIKPCKEQRPDGSVVRETSRAVLRGVVGEGLAFVLEDDLDRAVEADIMRMLAEVTGSEAGPARA